MLRRYSILTILCYVIFTESSRVAAQYLPVQRIRSGNSIGYVPNWSRITFSNLPPINTNGCIKFDRFVTGKLGYDPSRCWKAGDSADKYLMLGDVEPFGLSRLSLKDVDARVGTSTKNLALSNFGVPARATVRELTRGLPSLSRLPLRRVRPLYDLFNKSMGGRGYGGFLPIKQALQVNPRFASAKLADIDLSKYQIDSIPGLYQAPFGQIPGWQGSYISQIPGLGSLPFSSFPFKGFNIPYIATTDLTWGRMEGGNPKADGLIISGSGRKGATVPVPCKPLQPCAYLELSGPLGKVDPAYGKRWVSGLTQEVPGGEGLLRSVNGGMEPTGILVFGSAFKVVLLDVSEAAGQANFGLYFRFCVRKLFLNLGCTPYFIGPIPWLPTAEKQPLVIKL